MKVTGLHEEVYLLRGAQKLNGTSLFCSFQKSGAEDVRTIQVVPNTRTVCACKNNERAREKAIVALCRVMCYRPMHILGHQRHSTRA